MRYAQQLADLAFPCKNSRRAGDMGAGERQIACRGIDVVTTRPTAGIVKANRGC